MKIGVRGQFVTRDSISFPQTITGDLRKSKSDTDSKKWSWASRTWKTDQLQTIRLKKRRDV